MADIPSRDELAALDLLIEARARGVTADAGGVNGEISVLAATAHAIRETAGVAEPDRAATWAKVRAGMRTEPRRSRWAWPVPLSGLRAVASAAAVVLVAVLATVSVLLVSDGTAEAKFLAAVRDLDAFSAEALEDQRISADEAAQLEERVAAVAAALEDERERIRDLDPAELGEALATVTAVRAQLGPFEEGSASVARSAATLDVVSDAVQAVIERAEPGTDREEDGDRPTQRDSDGEGGGERGVDDAPDADDEQSQRPSTDPTDDERDGAESDERTPADEPSDRRSSDEDEAPTTDRDGAGTVDEEDEAPTRDRAGTVEEDEAPPRDETPTRDREGTVEADEPATRADGERIRCDDEAAHSRGGDDCAAHERRR